MADQYGREYDNNGRLATGADEVAEARVRIAFGRALECEARRFADMAPLDGYLVRDGAPVGVFEIKCRKHNYGTYPGVYLNLRKWLGLVMAAAGLGVPAYFAVGWLDQIGWVPLREVDPRGRVIMGGQAVITLNGRKDIEPVIDVPIDQFRLIGSQDAKD